LKKNPKAAAWKNKKKDGLFVQVDAKGLSSISFIPIGTKKKKEYLHFLLIKKKN